MGSNLILKLRIYLKSLHPFVHEEFPTFFTLKTSLQKSPQLFSSPRLLCTGDCNTNQTITLKVNRKNQKTEGQGTVKNKAIRQTHKELLNDAGNGRSKESLFLERPFFPKSVFAAGTAKRMADRMKRKASLVSEDVEQLEEGREYKAKKGAGTEII